MLDILPGDNKRVIDISSQIPKDILKMLDRITSTIDTILLTNGDVWRYFDAREAIFNHPNLQNKNVFLQTLGYTNIKVNDRCWELSYPLIYWKREKSTVKFVAKPSGLKYGFSCLNNRNTMHRTILGYWLYKNNLLGDIIFSQNITDSNAIIQASQDAKILNLQNFDEYRNLLPIQAQMENIPEGQGFRGNHNDAIPTHPAYTAAYCNIVTESECEEYEYPYSRNINLPVITEKSYKPLRAGQIPIMLAARGHIAYLKSLGFEMMEDLLPAGYDQMNVLQKIDVIVTTVSNGNEFIEDFYFSHLKEIQHNYKLINSNKVEKLVLQNIINIL